MGLPRLSIFCLISSVLFTGRDFHPSCRPADVLSRPFSLVSISFSSSSRFQADASSAKSLFRRPPFGIKIHLINK